MFIAMLFLVTKNQKQSEYPSGGVHLNKMRHVHSVDYYVAV